VSPQPHIDPETIALLAEGRVKRAELPALLDHLDHCTSCRAALEVAADTETEEEAGRGGGRVWWWAAAAAVMLAILLPTLRVIRDHRATDDVARLVELAPRGARGVEARLSGGFAWAAWQGPMRASGEEPETSRLKLNGVAGELVERASHDPRSADAQHAAGVALVMIDEPLQAIERLRLAATGTPHDARAWSDLAAARYAAAERLGRPSLLPEALAAADRALRTDPRLPEALFNRALILGRLGLTQEASRAWHAYLEVDPSSPWAVEARERLARLPAATGQSLFRRELPRLEQAAARGDSGTVATIVDRYRQQSRAFAEAEHLGMWGDAVQRGDAAEASRLLAVARAVGSALAMMSGESLLRESVRVIDAADPAQRALLANAHVLYRRGRIAYGRQRPSEAEKDLRLAGQRFSLAHSPMSLVARYYAANTRFDQNDVASARVELGVLHSESHARPAFLALDAQIRWELALCYTVDDDWNGALGELTPAAQTFARLGERSNEGFIETLLAQTFVSLGRVDDAWTSRIQSFTLLSAEGVGDRLAAGLLAAAINELRAGRFEAALPMLHLIESTARASGDDVLLADALVRAAVLDARLGDLDAASQKAREAVAVAARIVDPSLRARAQTQADFATAAALLDKDPGRAEELLNRAIESYQAFGTPAWLPESYLLRARARFRLGRAAEGRTDLESGIALLERHRIQVAGPVVGTGVLDAGSALYQDALRERLDSGDAAGAFAVADRSRQELAPSGGSPIIVNGLQRTLSGTPTAVLEISILPDEIVSFCVTAGDFQSSRQAIAKETVAALADAAAAGNQAACVHLYERLIRPFERQLTSVRELIVVADPILGTVPYAALYDRHGRRYLVESMATSLAMSAASLQRDEPRNAPRRALVAVALPSGEASRSVALPGSGSEVEDIQPLYPRSFEIAAAIATFPVFLRAVPTADVIHIAGHTERQPGQGEAALVFAGERVTWKTIASGAIGRTTIVVLAACETLCPPRSPQERALSLGGGFLAAGASTVIGTIAPIADSDARDLFHVIHQQLAAGTGAAEAVRQAQLAALARDAGGHHLTWRAVAVLTSRIPAPKA
jgi:tetratricopeptide (TPR) repeat protein